MTNPSMSEANLHTCEKGINPFDEWPCKACERETKIRARLLETFTFPPSADERIRAALQIARDYGTTEGAHHKAWAIDQMVRALVPNYEAWRHVGPSDWEEGVAP